MSKSSNNYNKLLEFSQELHSTHFYYPSNNTFPQKVLQILDKVLGYKYSLMSHLSNRSDHMINPSYYLHNIDAEFAKGVYLYYFEKMSEHEGLDIIRLSDIDPRAISSKTGVFSKNGYTDSLLLYIKNPQQKGKYLSYIMIFSKSGRFSDDDVELLKSIEPSIGLAEDTSIRLWNLNNQINSIASIMNYYPMGIMVVQNLNDVIYTNSLCRAYMAELGESDPRFYSTFYLNHIYPNYRFSMQSFGMANPIRIKNFIFNVVNTNSSSLGSIISENDVPNAYKMDYQSISTCVFIIKSSAEQNAAFSQETLSKAGLTKRESAIADLIAKGQSNDEIAETMNNSVHTIKFHISNIFKKMNVSNRAELIAKINSMHISD